MLFFGIVEEHMKEVTTIQWKACVTSEGIEIESNDHRR